MILTHCLLAVFCTNVHFPAINFLTMLAVLCLSRCLSLVDTQQGLNTCLLNRHLSGSKSQVLSATENSLPTPQGKAEIGPPRKYTQLTPPELAQQIKGPE